MADLKQVAMGKQGSVELAQILDDMLLNGNKYQRKVAEGASVMIRNKSHNSQQIAKMIISDEVKSPRIYNRMKVSNNAEISTADFEKGRENVLETIEVYFSPEERKKFEEFGIDLRIQKLPPDIAGQNIGKQVLIDPETAANKGFILEDVVVHEMMHLMNRIKEQEEPNKYFRKESVTETEKAIDVDRDIEESIAEIRTTARMGAFNSRPFNREKGRSLADSVDDIDPSQTNPGLFGGAFIRDENERLAIGAGVAMAPYQGDSQFIEELVMVAKGQIVPSGNEVTQLRSSGRFFRGSENPESALTVPGNTDYIHDSWYGGPEIDLLPNGPEEWDFTAAGKLWSDNFETESMVYPNTMVGTETVPLPYKVLPVAGLGWVAEWKLLGPDVLAVEDWLRQKSEREGTSELFVEEKSLRDNLIALGGFEAINSLEEIFTQSGKIRDELVASIDVKINEEGLKKAQDRSDFETLSVIQDVAKERGASYTYPSDREYDRGSYKARTYNLPNMVLPLTSKAVPTLQRTIKGKQFRGTPRKFTHPQARAWAQQLRRQTGRNVRVIRTNAGSRIYVGPMRRVR